MSRFDWLSKFLARCEDEQVLVQGGSAVELPPAHVLTVDINDWDKLAELAQTLGYRWVALWAEQQDTQQFRLNVCFEYLGDYLICRASIADQSMGLKSHSPYYPAANRPERHIQDMFGLRFHNHPDNRRWTRHKAWPDNQYPLHKTFPVSGTQTGIAPADSDYPFFQAQGAGVYEIPVGPVHAGIIEPGHFRFQAVGETVLNLEQRLGYTHKGIEKIAEGRDVHALARLACRISGDTAVAHSWAACMALERAAKLQVTPRALYLRALLAERERIANHLGDIGAIANDVGFGFALIQFGRLRELWQRLNLTLFGHRLLMDCVIPGGVTQDINPAQLDTLLQQVITTQQEVQTLSRILDENASLEERLVGTGYLSPLLARQLGVVGFVGKASGQNYDLRRDHRYFPYTQWRVRSPVYQEGDVACRLQVRIDEILQSCTLLLDLSEKLRAETPLEPTCVPWPAVASVEGLGLVEGWRGEILTYIQLDERGRVSRFFPRDPSWLNWPALEHLIHGNIVPDFPVCNKSVNASYSGQDL